MERQPESLPHHLTGRYQTYKQKTQEVVEWLLLNAESSDSSALSAATQTRRAPGSKKTLKIKTRALIDLAQTVKTKKTPVPTVILKDLEQVVHCRREFASWYKLNGSNTEATSNDGHQFFIGVCEKVHELLASSETPAPTKAGSKKGKGATSSSTIDASLLEKTVINLFAQLEVDEPSASPLGQAPKKNSKPSEEHASIELESDDRQDRVFAVWCHLQDMHDVRELITETWQSYAKGDVSLMAATLVLEVGLILLHSADSEFAHDYPDCSNWYAIANALGISMKSLGRGTAYAYPLLATSNSTDVPQPFSDKVVDLLCPGAANTVRVIHNSVKHAEPKLRAKSGIAMAPLRDEHYSFAEYIGDSIGELFYLSKNRHWRNERSEFIVGLVEYCASQAETMPMWLVVGCEIYCIIFQMIGSCPDIATRTWLDEIGPLSDSIKRYREYLGQAQFPIRPRSGDWSIELDKGLESYHNWTFHKRAPDGRHIRDKSHPRAGSRSLLELPCSMGNQIFSTKVRIHKAGLEITGDLQQVVIMAHLYTAMRRYGILKATWHDMDLVLAQQKSVQPLFPRLSTDPFAIVKHYLVALGTPLAAFANGQVPRPPPVSVVGPSCRRLQEPSQFIQNMDKRYDEARFQRQKLYEVVLTTMTSKGSSTVPSKKSQTKSPVVEATPVELLTTFKKVFISDEPQLNFDYFGFWMSCHSIFREILNDDETYYALEKEKAAGDDLDLCYVLIYLLLLGAAKAVDRGRPIEGLPINRAAELMEMFITTSGNEHSQAAFRASSGRIPKDLRPKLREWTPRPPSGAAAILSQDPASTFVGTASFETIYDPNGSEERFEIAGRLEGEIYAAAKVNEAHEWSEMMYKGAPWRYSELDVDG